MKIKVVKAQRLYLRIAEQISFQIQDGSLERGARLPSERDLAHRFQVSRPTIREAMIALELAGLVEVRSGSGVYVRESVNFLSDFKYQNDPGPMEILEARLYFESEAAALAAERITELELGHLDRALRSLCDADSKNKEHEDRQFHLIVAAATHNSAIESTVRWLWDLRDRSQVSQYFHERLRSVGIHPAIADHQLIYRAIAQRDKVAARSAMKDHLQRVMDVILADESEMTKSSS